MSDEYTLPVNDDIYITGETEEVVPDFSEIDDDDSTQETVTRTPAVISSDNRSSIGSGELNPSPSDVVPADVATSDVIVTQRVRHQIDDYEPAALKALSDAGAVFYGVYADGHEEGPVSWTEVHDLDPEGTIIELDEEIASAIAQNFWADTQGVHITDDPYNEWIEAYESNPQFPNLSTSKNYYNILLNAGGALLRRALNNLVSINRTAISFYDGLGNASTNIMAFFGRNGAQIGRSDEKHVVINSSGIGSYNGDGTVADFTMRGSSIVNSTISGSALVDNTITGGKIANATITGAKIDSGTITNANIANGTITGAKIDSGTITNANIADGTIQGSKIQGSTLTDIPFAAITDAEVEVASIADAQIATATITEAQVENLTTDYAHLQNGVIDNATINHADVNGLSTTYATISNLNAATARIGDLEADHVSVDDFEAEQANIDSLQAATADIATIRADSAKVHSLTAAQLSAATAYIAALNADNITAASLSADVGKIHNLTANEISAAAAYIAALNADSVTAQNIIAMNGDFATVKANAAKVANLTAAQLEADHATVGSLDANYAQINMANVNNAWIANGTIKDGAISSAMINDVSANKLTAGTINGSVINVTNLNADNITTGTINGQRIGEGSLSLSKLEDDVYTEAEVDAKLSTMQSQIDGAIETWTGTAVPTLQNSPASSWSTTALKDSHVGDVYFVVNSQSQQNGYNYRFTKSGSTYSWQLIKDSDVTNALQRLTTAEGKISTFDTDISQLKTDTGTLTTKTTSLETRMSDAEADILDKVDTTTFNEVSDTVDQHSQTISQHTTAISNKADSSTVTAVTNRVSKNEQDISGINTTIGTLQTTVESKADGSTVETMSTKLNTVSDTVDGHTQSISSITSTQTTMQGKLDKTLVETTQLWFSKADTTAPNKPTTQVTSTATTGNAWTTVVPAYNASYPNYYYCYQWKYSDGTYGWSSVTRDIAMGESQERARTAITNAATADTKAGNAATAASNAQSTANKNVKSSTQLWYTKANDTAPTKPASKITSTSVSGDGWRVVVPTYSASYPYYFYCWQYELADGTCAWSDVIYDRATTENQSNSRSAVSGVSTLTTKTNNIQDTVDGHTSQLSSITSIQTTIQGNAVKSTVQLWFTKANTTAPNKPTAHVTTNNAATGNAWNLAVPTYNASYPNYYYCYEYEYLNGTYGWSAVTRDIATGEMQERARTAITNAANAQADIDGLEIGGRNLVRGTAFANSTDLSYWYKNQNPILSVEDWSLKIVGNQTISTPGVYTLVSVNEGSCTVSFWYKAITSGGAMLSGVGLWNDTTNVIQHNCNITIADTEWHYYSHTFELTLSQASSINRLYIFLYQANHAVTDGLYINRLKLEKGNRATDWSPAPEDIDADISMAQTSADNAQATADKNVKESQQLWFTKANGSAPNKPTAKVTSTSTSGNAWTTKVPTYSSSYPYYFYCMQYIAADGTVTWSDVVYDQATTEAQSVARTTSANLSTLQSDYATFKQTTQNFESTIGTTYATKTELQTTDNKIENLEIGGRNLLRNSKAEHSQSSSTATWFEWPITEAPLDTAQDYTFSFDAKTSNGTDVFYVGFANGSAATQENMATGVKPTTTYTRMSVTARTTKTNIRSIIVSSTTSYGRGNGSNTGGTLYIKNIKLEKGTKATDWTPAPEDVDAAIDKVDSKTSVRLHLRRDNWSDANWGAYASVGHADNFVNIHVASGGGTYATGFDATTLNIGDLIVIEGISTGTSIPYSATAKVTSVPTSATGDIPATVISANNAKAIESRVSTAETSITQNTEQIALRAKSSDVYTKTQTDGLISTEVSNRNSAIQQSADAITTSVSQTYATKTALNTTNGNVTALQNRNDTLDAQYGYPYKKDIIVYGESNKYYPVYFTNTGSTKYDQYVTHEVMIKRGYAEQGPNDWNTSTHRGSLNLHFGWNYGGWGGATYKCDIYEFSEMYSTLLGDIIVGVDGGMFSIVYLRGGGTAGAIYHIYSDVPFIRHAYMTNAGVVGENDVPYVGLEQNLVYAKSGDTYQWKVRAPLTTPNVAHLTLLKTNTSMRFTLGRNNWNETQWALYSTIGHTDNWSPITNGSTYAIPDCRTLNVGDTFAVTGVSSDKSITHSIICEVTAVPTAEHGDVPAKTIAVNDNSTYAKAVESRVSTAETSIQQNTNSIALKANSSDVYTKTQTDGLISTEASNRNSAIEQSANAINLSVSQTYTTKTEFNALEVGGRNFLLNTENPTSSKPPKPIGDGITWGGVTNVTLSFTDGVMKLTSTSTSGEHYVRLNTPSHTQRVFEGMGVDVHDKLVLSGFIRASISAADGYVTVRSQTSTGSNWTNQITLKNLVTGVESTGSSVATILDGSSSEWVRFAVLIFIPESVTAVNEYFSFQQYGTFTVGDTFELKRLKLERGNKATDWSPAPEDMVTTTAFESAKSEIQQTTDGITSTVSKISSAKYLETSYQYTLAGCLSYAAEGYSGSWTVTDTKDAKVGDTVYLKVKDTTRNCFIYIKGTVTNVNGNAVRCTSHGYEDVLPVNTIKSTINQSSDSVKIEARHVNIEGAAIFSSGGRLSEESLNNTYDPKGAAQNAVSGAFDNRVSDSAEFLYRRTADGEDVPSGRATIQTIKGNTLRWNQLVNASMPIYVNSVFATREVNDGTVKATVNTVSLSASFYMLEMIYSSMNGHVLLCTADVKVTSSATSSTFSFGYESQGTVHTKVIPSGSWKHFATTLDVNMQSGASNYLYVYYDWTLNLSVGDTVELKNLNVFDLTQMFGAGNEPATVAEFEALYPKSYYPYDPGSLLPVRMEGVETVGFNQWDEEWEIGAINPATGENAASNNTIRAKHYITVFPKTVYYNTFGNGSDKTNFQTRFYDADKTYIGYTQKGNVSVGKNALFTTPENAHYMRFQVQSEYGTTYNHDICINISDPSRNGEYEPYWSSQCNIPTTELRSAGSVYDELQNSKRITRVGEVDLGTLTWVYDSTNAVFVNTSLDKANGQTNMACGSYSIDTAGIASMANMTMKGVAAGPNIYFKNTAYTDAATFKTAMSGVMLHYALATPATTPIDPPLNFVYKADASGTERILVDETKEAPQSSPVPMDITYGVNLYEDTIDDVLNISSRVSATEEAISPLASKTYTGIIGTANDANGASFYFGNVFPVEYDGIWKVHLRINVTEPVLYQQNIDIMISGHKSSYMSFDSVVSRSSSALAVYFINLYMATQTGINAGVGHALGFNLRASTNPTNTSYKRTISVDVLDVYNCSVKLFDTAVKYDNLPSYNTTNYGTHSTSASLTELSVSTNGQNASNNGNTYDRTYHNNPIKAATAITAGRIICGTSAGYKNIAAGTTFDISYPLLYSPNAIAVNSTRSDTYSLIPSINFSNNGTIQSGVAYAQLYLKGTIVGNTFTIAASPFMTTVVPTTEDGYFYIPMGIMSSATAGYFESSTAIYAFLDGKFRQVTPTEIVASHRVYYRTGTVNNSLAAPTTWVAEATGDVYNAWTTKIPPLSSGVSSTTKYPYLYTCEQRKRLDGTVECTKVLLDDSNTIIDGGTIITGSIAANKLDVYDATIGKISTSAINLTGYAQTDDIPTKVSDLTNDTGFVTNDDIQIGGRNLLRNTEWTTESIATFVTSNSTISQLGGAVGIWSRESQAVISIDSDGLASFTITGSTRYGIYQDVILDPGTYTLSALTGANFHANISSAQWPSTNSLNQLPNGRNAITFDVATKATYRVYINCSNGSTIAGNYLKLERGNKPTDWSPAPEDVAADISSKADPSDIPTKVSDLTNDSGFQNSSEVETAITSKGYQTSSQVETAITSKGYATQTSLNAETNQRKAQYGTCSTAAGTQAKAVTCSNFELVAGKDITVKFTTANTYASGAVQLNVNSKGAKNVWVSNAVTSSSNQLLWGANAYITFRYDGTQFIVIGEPRTWYGASTTAESTAAKTDTTAVTGCVICKGAKVELAMTNANTAAAPTLNIQSTGAKNVYFGNGTARPTKADGTSWLATNTCTFTFDGQYWRTAGKTYIDANSIVTGYLSADRIEAGSLSAGVISATSGTFDTANIPNLSSDKITVGGSTLTSNLSDKDSAIADAAKHTQVIISATNVNYVANTCTLTARLYIDGVLQTSTSLKWQWYRDGTTQGSQTTGATGSLAVTSSLGLAHRYACKCTF